MFDPSAWHRGWTQRLVEQQHFRADDQGARNGHALQLAAGELVRPALAVALQPHEGERAQ